MAQNYSFSHPALSGQGKSPSTGWHQANAGAGQHKPANRPQLRETGPAKFVLHGPDFSDINAFVQSAVEGETQSVSNFVVFGANPANRALGAGQTARGARRR